MTKVALLDALLGLPELEGPKVSRDGRWVAWTWYRAGPAADVYAAPTDGSAPPLRLSETDQETILVSWAPDSRSVLVAQDRDGDERAQLFQVDLDRPGTMLPLTEPSPSFFLSGGQLHPNGRWLVYGANLDVDTGREIEPTWVYRHDLVSGERLPLARPQRACHPVPRLNDTGTHILYLRNDLHPGGRQVWLVDIEGRVDREILNFGRDRKVSARWLPDGRRAAVLAEADTHQRVGLFDMATGNVRWLLDDPTRNVEAAYVPSTLLPAGGCLGSECAPGSPGACSALLVVLESRGARWRASFLDLDSGRETRLPELPGTLIPLALAGDNAGRGPSGRRGRPAGLPPAWIGQYYHARQPRDLVRFSLDDVQPGSLHSLTRIWERTPLTASELTPAEDFRWRSVDGLEVQGWLYRTRGVARGTIIYVHGGPTWHSEDWLNPQIQYLVAQGFTVLDPNYRGSTGLGRAYRDAIKVDGWGGREQEDIRTGIEALIAAGIAQPGKVGITGTSFGGYSAWYAITHWPPEVVAAAAPICGMTDLTVDWETTRPDLRPYSEEMMGGSPAQVPERYRQRSPIQYIERIRGRLLIVQGLQDPNVTPEHVRVVTAALDRAGLPYDVLAFADEGHGIHRPKNQRVLYLRLAQFFAEAFDAAA
jgi:dipeptidyl aminopeptidase/acylaminoacyl peptidase